MTRTRCSGTSKIFVQGSFPYLSLSRSSCALFLVTCLQVTSVIFTLQIFFSDVFSAYKPTQSMGYQLFKNQYKTFENSWNASLSLSTQISVFFLVFFTSSQLFRNQQDILTQSVASRLFKNSKINSCLSLIRHRHGIFMRIYRKSYHTGCMRLFKSKVIPQQCIAHPYCA